MSEDKKVNITVLLPAGRLPLDIMDVAYQAAEKYKLDVYLTNLQNLRLMGVPEEVVVDLKRQLSDLGADFKAPGKFPIPKVCVGEVDCNLGIIDTSSLSEKILEMYRGRANTKAKFKIAVAGCTMCCSNIKTVDIGIMATRDGFEIFAGGKGGPYPKIGRRIVRKVSEDKVLEVIGTLVDFHDKKTEKKQRMHKLLADSEFPFPEL